ncbi:hypothetical protein CTheo_1762 [Ceratobasidium theobromae]|uniref:Alcohol acetyltransferase n=1 Tax=Ceratobasidium theobromae TaxID=1582974 RepID=A0A5N5QTA0_9AGAM|nr:hypothetical protein CTheo_1762 [Ceratobasidium theobromae]
MVHPALEDCHWERRIDINGITTYTRPMVGGERVLDQVHQLMDGHDQLVFGVTLKSILPLETIESRLLDAMIYLRYHSPIIAAEPHAEIHDRELRSWVYAPLANAAEAKSWARESLCLKTGIGNVQDPESELCGIVSSPIRRLFQAYLLGPHLDNQFTLFVYMSHAVLEGNAAIDVLGTLLDLITNPRPKTDLEWGEEWRKLPPGAVVTLGGELEGWDVDSPALLAANAETFSATNPSHSLKPQRGSITKLGKIVRIHRQLSEQTTSRLIKAAKSEGISVTQLLEGAHVIATYMLEPLPLNQVAESHVRLFPSIVSTRHLRKPPYDTRESVSNLNAVFTQIIPGSLHVDKPTLRERVLAAAKASKENYRKFMSSPHYPFLLAAETKLNPLRGPLGVDINESAGEMLGLGVLDKKLGLKWSSPHGKEIIRISDVHLGLRQCAKRT